MLKLLSVLIALIGCYSWMVAAVTITQGYVQVQMQGGAPVFQVIDLRPNANNSFQVDIDGGLQEIAPGGKQLAGVPNFSGQSGMQFGPTFPHVVGSADSTCLDYNGTLPNGAIVSSQFCIVAGNTTVEFGNHTIFIPASSVKFALSVASWPFQSPNNFLQFQVRINLRPGEGNQWQQQQQPNVSPQLSKRSPPPISPSQQHVEQTTFNLFTGTGFFSFPNYAVLDGQATNITIQGGFQNNGFGYTFLFPSFTETLVYDPVVGFTGDVIDDSTSNAASNSIRALILMISLMLAAWLAL